MDRQELLGKIDVEIGLLKKVGLVDVLKVCDEAVERVNDVVVLELNEKVNELIRIYGGIILGNLISLIDYYIDNYANESSNLNKSGER